MFSIEDINEMQKTIERKDRIIKILKERVRQWVKEYNILDEIIEMYKMSENEANEIIAELKAENERLKEENKLIRQMHKDLSDKLFEFQKIEGTLHEIKTIAERAFAVCDDDCGNANKFKEIIELTKAEEE